MSPKPSKKRPAAKKPAANKRPVAKKKAAPKKAPAKKAPAKQAAAKKPAPRKPAPKKAAPKAVAKKVPAGAKPAVKAAAKAAPAADRKAAPQVVHATLRPAPRAPRPAPPPPPSHPVPARDAERYRAQLVTRKQAITATYNEYRERSQGFGDDGTQDVADQATNSYNKEFFLSLSQEHRFQIGMIDEALRRLDRGDYGICANCGDEIEPRRLNAVPWSTLCLKCQEAIDHQRPQDLL